MGGWEYLRAPKTVSQQHANLSFCNFHVPVGENHNNLFPSKNKDNKHSRAATNQYIKARIYCTKSEHRFSNILYSSSKRNPSDRTDSLHNIASSSTPFLHISRKLKCLKLLKWIRLSLLLHGMFPSFWRQTEYLWNAGKEKQKQIRNVI